MKDAELRMLANKALPDQEADKLSNCYFKKDGVLMRKWRPLNVSAKDEWNIHFEIVVPKLQRNNILTKRMRYHWQVT